MSCAAYAWTKQLKSMMWHPSVNHLSTAILCDNCPMFNSDSSQHYVLDLCYFLNPACLLFFHSELNIMIWKLSCFTFCKKKKDTGATEEKLNTTDYRPKILQQYLCNVLYVSLFFLFICFFIPEFQCTDSYCWCRPCFSIGSQSNK